MAEFPPGLSRTGRCWLIVFIMNFTEESSEV